MAEGADHSCIFAFLQADNVFRRQQHVIGSRLTVDFQAGQPWVLSSLEFAHDTHTQTAGDGLYYGFAARDDLRLFEAKPGFTQERFKLSVRRRSFLSQRGYGVASQTSVFNRSARKISTPSCQVS